jgi:hypothetical protein
MSAPSTAPVKVYQQVAPLKVIFDRLNSAKQPGKPLCTLVKIWPYPLPARALGEGDLPCLSVLYYEDEDLPFAGGRNPQSTGPAANQGESAMRLNNNFITTHRLMLLLSVSRERAQLFTEPGNESQNVLGMKDLADLIKDTIECQTDGVTPDASLNGTLQEPIMMHCRPTEARGDVSWNIGIEVVFKSRATKKGTRTRPRMTLYSPVPQIPALGDQV